MLFAHIFNNRLWQELVIECIACFFEILIAQLFVSGLFIAWSIALKRNSRPIQRNILLEAFVKAIHKEVNTIIYGLNICAIFIKDRHKVDVKVLLRMCGGTAIGVAHKYIAITGAFVRLPLNSVRPNLERRTIVWLSKHEYLRQEFEEIFIFLTVTHRSCIDLNLLLIVHATLKPKVILIIAFFKVLPLSCVLYGFENSRKHKINKFVIGLARDVNMAEIIGKSIRRYTILLRQVALKHFDCSSRNDAMCQLFLRSEATSEIIFNLLVNNFSYITNLAYIRVSLQVHIAYHVLPIRIIAD